MISKLQTIYPTADPKIYLIGDTEGLDTILAGRIAYVFKVESNKQGKIVKGTVTSGYRSKEEQTRLYELYKAGKLKLAAKPDTSKHQFRLAADMSTKPIRNMTSAELKQYGLCKPIKSEPWHIEPIEIQVPNWKYFEPKKEVEMTKKEAKEIVKEKAGLSDATIQFIADDYRYGDELIIKLAEAINRK